MASPLHAESSGAPNCFLAAGDNSGAVRSLQEALNSCYGKAAGVGALLTLRFLGFCAIA